MLPYNLSLHVPSMCCVHKAMLFSGLALVFLVGHPYNTPCFRLPPKLDWCMFVLLFWLPKSEGNNPDYSFLCTQISSPHGILDQLSWIFKIQTYSHTRVCMCVHTHTLNPLHTSFIGWLTQVFIIFSIPSFIPPSHRHVKIDPCQ